MLINFHLLCDKTFGEKKTYIALQIVYICRNDYIYTNFVFMLKLFQCCVGKEMLASLTVY